MLLKYVSVCLNICSAIQKIRKKSAVIFHRLSLFLFSGNSWFSSANLPKELNIPAVFWGAILAIFFLVNLSQRENAEKIYPAK